MKRLLTPWLRLAGTRARMTVTLAGLLVMSLITLHFEITLYSLPLTMFRTTTPAISAVEQSAARVKWLQEACRTLSVLDRDKLKKREHGYRHILVDDANHMLFCDAPKTGSSYFKKLWLNYTRGTNVPPDLIHDRIYLRKQNLRYLNTYNRNETQFRLDTYFKFMIARHPLVRVLSSYREKLERPNPYYHRALGRNIERQYGHVPAGQAHGDNVTFKQMVHSLIDHGPYDHHWTPVSLLCNPCKIAYDYIARLETSYLDYPYIFSKLENVPGSETGLPEWVTTYKGATDSDVVRKYYGEISVYLTNSLIQIYNTDFHLFGYTWNSMSQTYGPRLNADGNES